MSQLKLSDSLTNILASLIEKEHPDFMKYANLVLYNRYKCIGKYLCDDDKYIGKTPLPYWRIPEIVDISSKEHLVIHLRQEFYCSSTCYDEKNPNLPEYGRCMHRSDYEYATLDISNDILKPILKSEEHRDLLMLLCEKTPALVAELSEKPIEKVSEWHERELNKYHLNLFK